MSRRYNIHSFITKKLKEKRKNEERVVIINAKYFFQRFRIPFKLILDVYFRRISN